MDPRLISRAVVAACAAGLLLAATPAQEAPYPDWAKKLAPLVLDPESRQARLPPALRKCHPRVRRFLHERSAARWQITWPYFQGDVHESILAVEPPACGLDSGLDGVDSLEASKPLWLGPDASMVIIVGRRQGTSVVRFALTRRVDVRDPDLPYPKWSHELHSQWIFDFPTPVAAAEGEVFVKANLLGTTLYVLEGVGPKVIRWVDTDGDLLPDTRDPSFSVPMPDDSFTGSDLLSRGFAWASDDFVAFKRGCKGPQEGIKKVGGGFVFTRYEPGLDPVREHVDLDRIVGAGQDRVQAEGPHTKTVVIETAPGPGGPWTPVSEPAKIVALWYPQVVDLSAPLEQGSWVRARTAYGTATAARLVGPPRPVLFGPLLAVARPGESVKLGGDGLTETTSALFRPFDRSAPVPIEIVRASKHEIEILAPDLPATGGFVQLTRDGTDREPARFVLLLKP